MRDLHFPKTFTEPVLRMTKKSRPRKRRKNRPSSAGKPLHNLNLETLELRRMLSVSASTTPASPNMTGVSHVIVDFEIGYGLGQSVLDLDDVHLRTDAAGGSVPLP